MNDILRKIKRCLALANSSNPNEAATALRHAQALMAKHGLTKEDVAASEVSSRNARADAGHSPPLHVLMLARMIAGAFGCEFIYTPTHNGRRWQGGFEFYGFGTAPEIAGYAFEVLGRQLKRDRRLYLDSLSKRIKRATRVRRGDLYAQGWVKAASVKVVPLQRSEAQDKALATFAKQQWPDTDQALATDNTEKAKPQDFEAFVKGHVDGQKVSLHHGVNGHQPAAIERQVH